jgi:hypothetical protein
MSQLVIEYITEGRQRGYQFTSPTRGFNDETLKLIWRTAMPRGQGWGAYIGARSLKCFPLDDGRFALSEVTVTDKVDESGRRGIRRTLIDIFDIESCIARLRQRLAGYSADIQDKAARKPNFFQRGQIIDRALPKLNGKPSQVVLSHPYSEPHDWSVIEAVVIHLALAPLGPMKSWGKIVPFTTLALDHREEARLIALPSKQASQLRDVSVVEIR